MIKISIMLKRRAGITRGEFSEYWINFHAPKITSLPDTKQVIKRYIQQVAVDDPPEGLPIADFDGVAELWFDDIQSALSIMASKAYLEAIPTDEPNFIDPAETRIMITAERRCI